MRNKYRLAGKFGLLLAGVLFLGSYAHADEASDFNTLIKSLHNQRATVELQLGIDPNADHYPHATCYYDDLVDHYEHDQLMRDFIDKGLNQ